MPLHEDYTVGSHTTSSGLYWGCYGLSFIVVWAFSLYIGCSVLQREEGRREGSEIPLILAFVDEFGFNPDKCKKKKRLKYVRPTHNPKNS